VDKNNQILLTSQLPGETTSELLLVTDSPKDQGKWEKKKPSSHLPTMLSNKRGSSVPHKAQITKHQYQDLTPKEWVKNFCQED
jgi:hypothetical protein